MHHRVSHHVLHNSLVLQLHLEQEEGPPTNHQNCPADHRHPALYNRCACRAVNILSATLTTIQGPYSLQPSLPQDCLHPQRPLLSTHPSTYSTLNSWSCSIITVLPLYCCFAILKDFVKYTCRAILLAALHTAPLFIPFILIFILAPCNYKSFR